MMSFEAPEGVAKYAASFPKPAKTKNVHAMAMLQMQWASCVRCVDWIVSNPDKAVGLEGFIQGQKAESATLAEKSRADAPFGREVAKVEKVPLAWQAEWLANESSGGSPEEKLAKEDLNRVEKVSRGETARLFKYVTGTKGTTKFPKLARDKAVASKMFSSRAKQMGDRWKLIKAHILPSGEVDWSKLGAYQPCYNDQGDAVKVVHSSGVEAPVVRGKSFNKSFNLVGNEDDMAAHMELDGTMVKLCSLFKQADAAPWTYQIDKVDSVLEGLATALDGAQACSSHPVFVVVHHWMSFRDWCFLAGADGTFLDQGNEARKKEALAKARAKRAAEGLQTPAGKRSKTVILGSDLSPETPPPPPNPAATGLLAIAAGAEEEE